MITIREFRNDDFAEVCAIHDRARPGELRGSAPETAYRPMRDVAEEDGFFDSQTLVATEERGRVVGFASWRGKKITWFYAEGGEAAEVSRELLEAVLERMGEGAWLNTMAQNLTAIAFYRQGGFEAVREFAATTHGVPCRGVRMELGKSE